MANPSASPLSPPSSSSANQGPILQFAPFNSIVDDGFWRRFSALKLDTLRIDQSPIPISGFFAPCSHSSVSNYLTLLSESLPSDSNIQSPSVPVKGNRNKCPIPGTLLNTNTLESFRALEKEVLLKAEAKRV